MLSPRIIHFGPQEMFWECREDMACTCDRAHDPVLLEIKAMSTKLQLTKHMGQPEPALLGPLWRDLIEEYSQLSLTKSSDKLPAIEGLVSIFRPRRLGEEYAELVVGVGRWRIIPSGI